MYMYTVHVLVQKSEVGNIHVHVRDNIAWGHIFIRHLILFLKIISSCPNSFRSVSTPTAPTVCPAPRVSCAPRPSATPKPAPAVLTKTPQANPPVTFALVVPPASRSAGPQQLVTPATTALAVSRYVAYVRRGSGARRACRPAAFVRPVKSAWTGRLGYSQGTAQRGRMQRRVRVSVPLVHLVSHLV